MRYRYLVLLLIVAVGPVAGSRAGDESESLAVLVATIDANDNPAVRGALLRGMLAGLEGRRNVDPPKGWNELSSELASSDDPTVRDLASHLSQIFGDRAAMGRALDLVRDSSAEASARRTALRSLLNQQSEEASEILASLIDDPSLAIDAIRGYSIVENPSAPEVLLQRYKELKPELRRAAVETLASRKSYATELLAAIERGVVARDEIPAHVARSLGEILGDPFFDVFGEIRSVDADRVQQMEKYKQLITPEAIAKADASRGRALFKKTCGACHLLYGEGGNVGPDLTGSNRANLDYILLNSVDPSYDVPDAYKTVQVLTNDGRVINGVLAEEDAVRIVLKTAEQPRVVIAKEDIETRRISPKSMMPDGQFDQLKPQEVIDLVKYLRTTEQVELPE